MREIGFRVAGYVRLHLLPIAYCISDLLAGATNTKETPQFREFSFARFVGCALGFDPLRYIDATADVSAERAIAIMKGNATVEDPPIQTVGAL